MNTAERLQGYYDFSQPTIQIVSEFAGKQAMFATYQDFLNDSGVAEAAYLNRGTAHIDIRPKEHDPAQALIMHLPMANPLDPNQLYQIATVAGTNPNKRIIAMANPSGPGYDAGKLSPAGLFKVYRGDFSPVAEQLNRVLEEEGIEQTEHYGYSYGADTLPATMSTANNLVKAVIALDPASGIKRNVVKLGLDFASSAKLLGEYTRAPGLPTFDEARKASVTAFAYNFGLARLTNLALANGISRGLFFEHFREALEKHKDTISTLAWFSDSELANDAVTTSEAAKLQKAFGTTAMRFAGQTHAAANDIHLQAAIILEALPQAA